MMPRSLLLLAIASFLMVPMISPAQAATSGDAGQPFGTLPLVDEVVCGNPRDPHAFTEVPQGSSKIETILGSACRVLPNDSGPAKYFAYRLGQGKGLKPGKAYVLTVEYPEDVPRTIFVSNRGCETNRGFHTGSSLGDVLYTYTNNNPESLKIPLAKAMRTWQMFFFLHDRFPDLDLPKGNKEARAMTPEQGFWVIISQAQAISDPASQGAAVAHIRLFEVTDPASLKVQLKLPPADLPRRHLLWREEMADGVIADPEAGNRGVGDDIAWFEYKARLMQFLGMNTFSKDLLEFGHNQGWDAEPYGGNNWYWASKTPQRWEKMLTMLGKYNFTVMPYYEYCGSVGKTGLGKELRCLPLGGKLPYTHIKWSEISNADITDPDTLADANKLLDATITRFKDKVTFIGAWFRTRPSAMPMSFSDRCLGLFAREANHGKAITREQLKVDKALLNRYDQWWFGKRQNFLDSLADHLRTRVNPNAVVLFTADSSEPGRSLPGNKMQLVTDDLKTWNVIAAQPDQKMEPVSLDSVLAGDKYLQALLAPVGTWGNFEWQHSIPQADPLAYKRDPKVLMTYSFSRSYTVASAKALDAFRTPTGLAMVRHFALNENTMDKSMGYFVSDVEYSGPYCMLAEARAMANGDPRYIGYLTSNSFNRGFPEYVRAFNAAFLSLPALPSQILGEASSDSQVVVRIIRTPANGIYLAVVNTALIDKKSVTIKLPGPGAVTDAATGKTLNAPEGKLVLSLYPCQLQSLHLQPAN